MRMHSREAVWFLCPVLLLRVSVEVVSLATFPSLMCVAANDCWLFPELHWERRIGNEIETCPFPSATASGCYWSDAFQRLDRELFCRSRYCISQCRDGSVYKGVSSYRTTMVLINKKLSGKKSKTSHKFQWVEWSIIWRNGKNWWAWRPETILKSRQPFRISFMLKIFLR